MDNDSELYIGMNQEQNYGNPKFPTEPKTRYLPLVEDDTFDLRQHLETVCKHDLLREGIKGQITVLSDQCYGYLLKLFSARKPNETEIRSASCTPRGVASGPIESPRNTKRFLHPLAFLKRPWRKRWFLLDRKRRLLTYYTNQVKSHGNSIKPRGLISFADIVDVYPDHYDNNEDGASFCIQLVADTRGLSGQTKSFWLRACNHYLMRLWVDAIFTCAGAYTIFKQPTLHNVRKNNGFLQ
ncbi:hypothetical protein Ciccas_007251 [Cichlidogyrus casuarinus]|uniref:PH domain-containing protein n=1 Tax=Cichlidogyrus casuarinus TaxID=1844966 RepID=A0ABD2Q7E0_9PLAT